MSPTILRFGFVALIALLFTACGPMKAKTIPTDGSELLQLTLTASHPVLLAHDTTKQQVTLDIRASLPPDFDARRHLNMSVVVDHSGSMTGPQMEDARQAILALLDQLEEDDTVSVVAFSSDVDVLLPQSRWGDVEVEELREKIAALRPMGTTSMVPALSEGYGQVASHFDAEGINRIILLSDGDANNPSQLPVIADNARAAGIAITTMGLGPFYNEEMLALLADRSGGRYRFIEKSSEIGDFFLAEISAMQQLVASNAQLAVTLGPNVEIVQGFGGQFNVAGNQVWIPVGDLSAGDTRQLALELNVAAGSDGAHVEVLDAHLTWTDAVHGTWESYEKLGYLGAESSADEARVESALNTEIVELVGQMQASWEVAQAVSMVNTGEIEAGQAMLRQAAERYRANGFGGRDLDDNLDLAADQLMSAPEAADTRLNLKKIQTESRSVFGM